MPAAKYERRTLEDIRRMLAEHPADAGGRSPDIHSARRADIARAPARGGAVRRRV